MNQSELRAYLDRSRAETEMAAEAGDEHAIALRERLREIDRSYFEGLAAINSACDEALRRSDRLYYRQMTALVASLLGLWVACAAFLAWLAG